MLSVGKRFEILELACAVNERVIVSSSMKLLSLLAMTSLFLLAYGSRDYKDHGYLCVVIDARFSWKSDQVGGFDSDDGMSWVWLPLLCENLQF